LGLFLAWGCGDESGLATMRLPLAAELPGDVDRIELQLDGALRQIARPFPSDWVIDVAPGPIANVELIARNPSATAIWYGQTQGVVAAEDQVVDVELALDPAGEMRFLTVETLGPQITVFAVPTAPVPGTPLRYPVPVEGLAYSRVLPVGQYMLRAQVDGGVIMPETTIGSVTVEQGRIQDASLDLSDLEGLGNLF
jgi:hypothetical protein